MFGISGFELVIIAAFALIVFGPDKVPDMARTVGRVIRQFQRTQEEMEAMVRAEMLGDRRAKVAKAVGDQKAAVTAADMSGDEENEEEEEE